MATKKNNPRTFLYALLPLVLFTIVWFIGDEPPVTSARALSFIWYGNRTVFLILIIAANASCFIAALGWYLDWFAVRYNTYIWIGTLALAFSLSAHFANARSQARTDPNVSFRYHQFAISKGWEK